MAVFYAIACAAVAALVVLLLGLYNGLAWIGQFTLLTLGCAAASV
ncbi:hypothetical protein [Streptomyces sp. F001]|nr:hypothetical protein [Streptomyces sp. F001]